MGEQIMRRLADHRFAYVYEHKVYDSGHNGLIINKDCWRAVFDFLQRNFT